jgi:ElaB/YqjD/DUF883 family membrane-anchored ribosome-binding protein
MNPNELTEQAGEKIQETTQSVTEKARDLTARAGTKVREFGTVADAYIHEYPYSTITMVAVFAGVIGFLLGRQRD